MLNQLKDLERTTSLPLDHRTWRRNHTSPAPDHPETLSHYKDTYLHLCVVFDCK